MYSNLDALTSFIQKTVQKENNKLQIGNIAEGIIKEVLLDGFYRIQKKDSTGSEILASSLVSNNVLKMNDLVLYIAANNAGTDAQYNNNYIVGLVNNIYTDFFNLSAWERFTPLSSGEVALFKNEKLNLLNGNHVESVLPQTFIENLNNHKSFSIQAKFTTNNIPDITDFGFKIDITFDRKFTKTILFNSHRFEGQVKTLNGIYQKALIQLNELDLDFLWKNVTDIKITHFYVGNFIEDSSQIIAEEIKLNVGTVAISKESLSVDIKTPQGEKNYFNISGKESQEDNTVTLQAVLKNKDQPIESSFAQYYWFIKDDSVQDISNNGYSAIGGIGWRILNPIKISSQLDLATGKIVPVSGWETGSNILKLKYQDYKLMLSNYKNIIRCIVKYNWSITESKEYIVYNYNSFDFSKIELIAENNDGTILNDALFTKNTKYIVLKGNTEIDDVRTDVVLKYIWKVSQGHQEINISTELFNDNINKITIVPFNPEDSNKAGTAYILEVDGRKEFYYMLASGESSAHFSWTVEVFAGAGQTLVHSQTITKTINILVNEISKIDYTYAYYWSLDNPSVQFTKINSENGLPNWNVKNNPIEWSFVKDFDELKKLIPPRAAPAGYYYLYYTVYEREYLEKAGLEEDIRIKDWTRPQVIKKGQYTAEGYWLKEQVNSESIQELNTFNSLTANGTDNGIFYSENKESYFVTTDSIPDAKKIYYVYNTDTQDYEEKTVFDNFDNDKEYYEKDNDSKLYINATYIQTGTLRVGKHGTEKFYASIHDEDVRIGGWLVNDTQLISSNGTVGMSSNNSEATNIAFWAGNKNGEEIKTAKFRVTHDGNLHAEDGDIGGWIIDGKNLTSGMVSLIGTSAEEQGLEDPIRIATSGHEKTYNFLISSIEEIEPVAHMSTDVTDDIVYEGEDALRQKEIAEFGFDEFNVPKITFKDSENGNDPVKDEKQYYLYAGQYIWNDILCDKWVQYWQDEDGTWLEMPHAFLTNVIVDISINPDFYVTNSGYLYAKNARIEGVIVANKGSIGGWEVNDNQLISSNGTVGMRSDNSEATNIAFWAGSKNNTDTEIQAAKFRVTHEGSLYADKGSIGGFHIGRYSDNDTTIKNGLFATANAYNGITFLDNKGEFIRSQYTGGELFFQNSDYGTLKIDNKALRIMSGPPQRSAGFSLGNLLLYDGYVTELQQDSEGNNSTFFGEIFCGYGGGPGINCNEFIFKLSSKKYTWVEDPSGMSTSIEHNCKIILDGDTVIKGNIDINGVKMQLVKIDGCYHLVGVTE